MVIDNNYVKPHTNKILPHGNPKKNQVESKIVPELVDISSASYSVSLS